ncbi:hypothetical protein QKQ66_gp086 [Dione juno nucleopolyhedrovirus]|uniref:Uncharacterized protein n=1 Tax=Dione juno nucleopolyhedrovirus TaxID=2594175 RepID=A0AAE6H3Y4_9ABAC|nr:hypothetical protein QKQ66_gp086 [Dione juno nucleopolyhedrovirus]QDL56977.1 hypothetical protein DijuNPV-ORF-86 [Dione juno nucleopolyhedrovirus]
MATFQTALIDVQNDALDLALETNSFLNTPAAEDTDLETRLTRLAMRADSLDVAATVAGRQLQSVYYEVLKSNAKNSINILIDLILIKKYV